VLVVQKNKNKQTNKQQTRTEDLMDWTIGRTESLSTAPTANPARSYSPGGEKAMSKDMDSKKATGAHVDGRTWRIHARHLGGLASGQRAASQLAAVRDSLMIDLPMPFS